MDKDIISICFDNKANFKKLFFTHEVFCLREFKNNRIEEGFVFHLTNKEIKELANALNAAAD